MENYGLARQATDENIIRNMLFACQITKATNTQAEYFILLAFPRQRRLREIASALRLYTHCLSCVHTACLVYTLPVLCTHCLSCVHTACLVYTLPVLCTHCVSCIHIACLVYTLRVLYTHCLSCIHIACLVYTLRVLYTHCLSCVHTACLVYTLPVLLCFANGFIFNI